MKKRDNEVLATCHCGAIKIGVPAAPTEVTHCNCTLCRRYGVLWAYYPIAAVSVNTSGTITDTYGGRSQHVDFHRCRVCGCVTYWFPRDSRRKSLGLNARLLEPELLAAASIRYKDDAGTGKFQ
jgi:hypothetical protein